LVPTLYPRAPPRRASFVVFSVSSRFYRAVGAASRGYPPGRFLHRTERSPCTKQSRKLRTRLSSEPSFGTIHRRYYLLRASRVPTGTTTNPWERCVMPGSVSPTTTATIEKAITTTATSIRRVHRLIKNQRQTFSNTPQPSAGKITETRERCETHHVRWNSTRKIRVSRAISGSCTSLASSSTKMALAS